MGYIINICEIDEVLMKVLTLCCTSNVICVEAPPISRDPTVDLRAGTETLVEPSVSAK